MLRSAQLSGQREHRGQIVGPAVWPAILTPEQTQRIRGILDDPARRTNRTARRYLLTGLCDAPLYSHRRKGTRRYVCRREADRDGCGKITVTAEPVETLVAS